MIANMIDLLDSAPSFTIANPPNTPSNEKLVSDLLLQDMHNRGGSRCGDKELGGSLQGGISANIVCLVTLRLVVSDNS